jgi:hypothetical protein
VEEHDWEESVLLQPNQANLNGTTKGLGALLDDLNGNRKSEGEPEYEEPILNKVQSDGVLLMQRALSDSKSQVVISKRGLVKLQSIEDKTSKDSKDDVFGNINVRNQSSSMINKTREQIQAT